MSKQQLDQTEYGENGYPVCRVCNEEIVWGELQVYWTTDFFHPKCWDKFCEDWYD